jgi:hypothetical protein
MRKLVFMGILIISCSLAVKFQKRNVGDENAWRCRRPRPFSGTTMGLKEGVSR